MRIAYADPPYIGLAHRYKDHPDYGGEVDHGDLLAQLDTYDGWILHLQAPSIPKVAALVGARPVRWCAWVKPFAAFKRNVSPAYAWEPVIVAPARHADPAAALGTCRDWVAEPMTMRRGLVGAKPERVVHWALDIVGADPADEVADLFPGSGAVGRAWETWRARLALTAAAEVAALPGIG